MQSLERVLRELHLAGINCGVATAPPAHIGAWIEQGGERTEQRSFEISGLEGDAIARWLEETAARLYPPSVRPLPW